MVPAARSSVNLNNSSVKPDIAAVGGGVLGNLYGDQGIPWMPGYQK